MLFTPRKYGRDWTLVLSIFFSTASLGFAFFAIAAVWTVGGSFWDKLFVAAAFTLAAVVFAALGRDQWKKAAKMKADDDAQP